MEIARVKILYGIDLSTSSPIQRGRNQGKDHPPDDPRSAALYATIE
jgi:hypothetical protein